METLLRSHLVKILENQLLLRYPSLFVFIFICTVNKIPEHVINEMSAFVTFLDIKLNRTRKLKKI